MNTEQRFNEYLDKHKNWVEGLLKLRALILSTGLKETIKWGAPVYTLEDKNIVGLGAFKSYFGLWFFQGALLADQGGHLFNAQQGKTKALRQWRFNSVGELNEQMILKYVHEAIQNQKDGLEIKAERGKAVIIPLELQDAFDSDAELKNKFDELTLSKRRDYAEHIGSAKREETRTNRLHKCIPMIKSGIGLNDKYKNC